MSTLIKQSMCAAGLLLAASLCLAPAAQAAEPKAKATAKAKSHPKAAKAVVEAEPTEPEPDITDTTTTEFECELGNKVTTYHNDGDPEHIAIRWKKRVHRLTRVGTTTGARRWENPVFGLIWIGIPAKGMLLDSKLNRQLANECKNAEQLKPPVVEPAVVPAVVPAVAPAPVAMPATGAAAETKPKQ